MSTIITSIQNCTTGPRQCNKGRKKKKQEEKRDSYKRQKGRSKLSLFVDNKMHTLHSLSLS